jgi:hypothetical protein
VSSVIPLGNLEAVDLRTAWPDEAKNFTPWLAEDDNLAFLGSTLGLQLELEAVEKEVGPFSADILAKDLQTDRWVLIENQIESTDHNHLGQLLTYAAGLDAPIVVWIAKNFREQHRAALDYLNRSTAEEFLFFGVQIELLKIGESAFAPSFSVVAKPNNWSKQSAAIKKAAKENLSPMQILSLEFWGQLIEGAETLYPALVARKPYKGSWQTAERLISSKTFYVENNAAFTSAKRLRVEAYIGGPAAKVVFAKLKQKQVEIEAAITGDLEWEELPEGQDSRIALYMPGYQSRDDRNEWKSQHDWILANWKPFADAIRPFLQDLKVEWSTEE